MCLSVLNNRMDRQCNSIVAFLLHIISCLHCLWDLQITLSAGIHSSLLYSFKMADHYDLWISPVIKQASSFFLYTVLEEDVPWWIFAMTSSQISMHISNPSFCILHNAMHWLCTCMPISTFNDIWWDGLVYVEQFKSVTTEYELL